MQGLPWKRHCLDGSICSSKTCIYFSALMVHFHVCKLSVPLAPMHAHTIRDAGFLNWALITSQYQHSPLLSGGHGFHDFPPKNITFWFVRQQNSDWALTCICGWHAELYSEEMSPDSLNLLMILCSVGTGIFKVSLSRELFCIQSCSWPVANKPK